MPFAEARKTGHASVPASNCHDLKNEQLRIIAPWFMKG
jgi:hypothetical protein